jgi:hypothetical protein
MTRYCPEAFSWKSNRRPLTSHRPGAPKVRRDLAGLGQLDHVHRRRVTALPALPAFQRGFKFPDRRLPRAADGVERKASAGLTAIALDLKLAQAAVDALPDGWQWLRGPAVAFHLNRPRECPKPDRQPQVMGGMFPMGAARRWGMVKIAISNVDLVWVFTEKLKSFRDDAPAISIAIVPDKDGWSAIASRNDRNHHPRCAKRIEQVQRELRENYVLARD